MNYRFVTSINKNEYDAFVQSSPYVNLLQSYDWALIKHNWKHIYTGVYKDEKLVGAGLVLIKELPLKMSMFYIPRGPILDFKDKELVCFYFEELKKEAKKHHCLFIKFDPMIHVNDYKSYEANDNKYKDTDLYLNIFKEIGAQHHGFTINIYESVQPRFLSNVYNEVGWMDNLPKHTKRLIKDADKRNVRMICGNAELVDEFSRLVELTEERKHISLRNKEYFKLLMDTYKEDGVIFLACTNVYQLNEEASKKYEELMEEKSKTLENAKKKLRRLQDQLNSISKDMNEYKEILDEFGYEDKDIAIAGILSIKYGNTCDMLYAGMDKRFKKFMPQYKEYVENFKWAFDKGCIWSSMGGVEGTLDDGLTKFKDNFNPTINELIGEFDLPVNKMLYNLSQIAYKLLKK